MIELELKALVPELATARRRIETSGARLVFAGRLEDVRYDYEDRRLAGQDLVLRLRVYRDSSGTATSSSLDWKGPSILDGKYKQREELNVGLTDPDTLATILERLGLVVTMRIDRDIWQYELHGAIVRFERYPRMDDLVEVEGSPDDIESAIRVLGLSRDSFTTERLPDFARRFEARTGQLAALSDAELAGTVRYDVDNA
ncbi:MAG TPA: class IV adenylate cyclase [Kofleriaceae bacterium]|nr:class IV adenylate cyclase [Kofleriaceae bacterium]